MQAFLYLTDGETKAHTRPQSWLRLSQDQNMMTYLASSPRHFPLESTAHADLASLGSPREGGADLSCWIRSSPSLMTLSVASRVAVCCCWNCLISSWTASTESAQTSSSISFWRSSIHVHSCGGESRDSTQGTWERPGLGLKARVWNWGHPTYPQPVSAVSDCPSNQHPYGSVYISIFVFTTHLC